VAGGVRNVDQVAAHWCTPESGRRHPVLSCGVRPVDDPVERMSSCAAAHHSKIRCTDLPQGAAFHRPAVVWVLRALIATYSVAMVERLTHRWRRETAEQEAAVAAVDAALTAYEQEIASLNPTTDDAVWVAVERVVVALNGIDLAFGQHIETMTREELSEYIETVLAEAGINVEALLERRGVDEAAGEWRDS
jgi:hypothetical protein